MGHESKRANFLGSCVLIFRHKTPQKAGFNHDLDRVFVLARSFEFSLEGKVAKRFSHYRTFESAKLGQFGIKKGHDAVFGVFYASFEPQAIAMLRENDDIC